MLPRKRRRIRRMRRIRQSSEAAFSIEDLYEESEGGFMCKICQNETQTEGGIRRHIESKHEDRL